MVLGPVAVATSLTGGGRAQGPPNPETSPSREQRPTPIFGRLGNLARDIVLAPVNLAAAAVRKVQAVVYSCWRWVARLIDDIIAYLVDLWYLYVRCMTRSWYEITAPVTARRIATCQRCAGSTARREMQGDALSPRVRGSELIQRRLPFLPEQGDNCDWAEGSRF